jgi:hypothetical protein
MAKSFYILKKSCQFITTLTLLFCASSLYAQTTNFTYSGSIQSYIVPSGVTSISIETFGAQGKSAESGRLGGLGARMKGDFTVTPGSELLLLVGEEGKLIVNNGNGGGGGGTFVVVVDPTAPHVMLSGPHAGKKVRPLIIAGGGGGTRAGAAANGSPGVITQNATTGSCSNFNGAGSGLISSTASGIGGLHPVFLGAREAEDLGVTEQMMLIMELGE